MTIFMTPSVLNWSHFSGDFFLPGLAWEHLEHQSQNLSFYRMIPLVLTSQLLLVLREIQNNTSAYDGVHVDQIYDFWA